jgi:hypothetical protein
MTPDEHNHLPQLHADIAIYIARYLTVTEDIPLPQFDAFLVDYRRTYLPPKKKTKKLRLVVWMLHGRFKEIKSVAGRCQTKGRGFDRCFENAFEC